MHPDLRLEEVIAGIGASVPCNFSDIDQQE